MQNKLSMGLICLVCSSCCECTTAPPTATEIFRLQTECRLSAGRFLEGQGIIAGHKSIDEGPMFGSMFGEWHYNMHDYRCYVEIDQFFHYKNDESKKNNPKYKKILFNSQEETRRVATIERNYNNDGSIAYEAYMQDYEPHEYNYVWKYIHSKMSD